MNYPDKLQRQNATLNYTPTYYQNNQTNQSNRTNQTNQNNQTRDTPRTQPLCSDGYCRPCYSG